LRRARHGGGAGSKNARAAAESDPAAGSDTAAASDPAAASDTAAASDSERERQRERERPNKQIDTRNIVCVIGDGAMSAGMAYEAMNNAGARHTRLLVVLNDNDMSIAPPVGAMSAYLSRLMSSQSFLSLRELAGRMARHFPRGIERTARRAEEYARGILTGGTLFEELGFYYVGPIDGH